MKRPILIALIGYIIGIIWELYLKESIAPVILIVIILYCIYKSTLCRGHTVVIDEKKEKIQKQVHQVKQQKIKVCRGTTYYDIAIITLIVFMIISRIMTSYLNNKYEKIYKTSTEEQTYIGTIISDVNSGQYSDTYTIRIESINKKYKNIKLKLNIPNNYKIKLEYGDKIKFKGKYSAPEIQRNYKGFNYSEYLKTLKIYGTVKCTSNKIQILKKQDINIIKLQTHKISNNIQKNIKKILPSKEAGLLTGILLGNNQNIDEETKDEFRNSGIYHILAVSGAHMSYVILGITYLLNIINIGPRKKQTLAIIGIIFFILITNTSVSVVRAGIMGIITLGASLFYRKKDIINSVSLSMLIILIYNPYNINSISFQLSYGGVIGILVLNRFYIKLLSKTNLNKKIIETISVILSAQTMIIPIMILNFHTISLTFLFANIIVSYLIGIVIILGFICSFLSLISMEISNILSILLDIPLKLLILIAKLFGSIPLSKIYITTPSIISIILYYLIIFVNKLKITTYKDKIQINKILVILLIITLICNQFIKIPTFLEIYFIDVGQGDSTLIVTPNNKKILIDGGGSTDTTSSYDVGKDTLVPYLLNRGIKNLDYIMISHFDADHCQGLIAVLDTIKVKNIIISKQAESVYNYEKIMEIVVKKKINLIIVKKGDVINVDKNVEIKIIYPESKLYFDDINNNSIVAKLCYKNFSILFTGDVEKGAEERLVEIAKNELKSTILKIPHHGSNTSSTQEFLNVVKPQIALIGVGKNNKFGHPGQEVINRLENMKVKIYRTDQNGEIIITTNGNWIKEKVKIENSD